MPQPDDPPADLRVSDEAGSGERLRVIHMRAEPGPIAHHGPIDIVGNSSVSDNVVRRQLTFRTAKLGGAVAAAPLIVSIAAPVPASAATPTPCPRPPR